MAAGIPSATALPAKMRAVASPTEWDRLLASWTMGFVTVQMAAAVAAWEMSGNVREGLG